MQIPFTLVYRMPHICLDGQMSKRKIWPNFQESDRQRGKPSKSTIQIIIQGEKTGYFQICGSTFRFFELLPTKHFEEYFQQSESRKDFHVSGL